MQGMEASLGVDLLERTTRSVHVTRAGEFLSQESTRLLGDVDQSIRRLKEEYGGAGKQIRIGVSPSISPAYLPGFFHANIRLGLKANYSVTSQPCGEILSALEANELDLGVLCPPHRISRTLFVTHRFTDAFVCIALREGAATFNALSKSQSARHGWLQRQNWLLLNETTNTGHALRRWMAKTGFNVTPAMQLDSFDLIINLVSLGMGISFVPIRALALYGPKKSIARLQLSDRFERQLVVVMRRHRKKPEHLAEFVANILF